MAKKIKKNKKLKIVKLNKKFAYALAVVSILLLVKGFEGMSGITGAVIGASQTDVKLISFASFFVGAFLAVFSISQIVQKK